MDWFETDGAFWAAFRRFDALDDGQGQHWETPTAQKRHADLFGDAIAPGEMYFRRRYAGRGDVLKLSLRSMERLLFAVVAINPWLAEAGERRCRERREQLLAAIADWDAWREAAGAAYR